MIMIRCFLSRQFHCGFLRRLEALTIVRPTHRPLFRACLSACLCFSVPFLRRRRSRSPTACSQKKTSASSEESDCCGVTLTHKQVKRGRGHSSSGSAGRRRFVESNRIEGDKTYIPTLTHLTPFFGVRELSVFLFYPRLFCLSVCLTLFLCLALGFCHVSRSFVRIKA